MIDNNRSAVYLHKLLFLINSWMILVQINEQRIVSIDASSLQTVEHLQVASNSSYQPREDATTIIMVAEMPVELHFRSGRSTALYG